MAMFAARAWFCTVLKSQISVLFRGSSMTVNPIHLLAVHLEMAREMKAPPMPKMKEKANSGQKSMPY